MANKRPWIASAPRDIVATERKRATFTRPTAMDASLATYADNYRLHDGKLVGTAQSERHIVVRWDTTISGHERAMIDMANGVYSHLSDHRPDGARDSRDSTTRRPRKQSGGATRNRTVDGTALHNSRVVHYATVVRAAHYPTNALRNDVPKKFRADVARLLNMDV